LLGKELSAIARDRNSRTDRVFSMAGTIEHGELTPERRDADPWASGLAVWARAAAPHLIFGFRLWAAVCLALYIAFWLELDNAYWAGTTAALMSQPHLGASLRKGWFRMIGTVVGAVAIVILSACFPQDRLGFLVGLALWGAVCAFVATLMRNFAAYSAALAGYTAIVIANDELGSVGGLNGDAFMLAITRVSEIWIGIVCASVVLAGTDFGAAPHRLGVLLGDLLAKIAAGVTSSLERGGWPPSQTQPVRRELIRQVTALDPAIDEAVGESPSLRFRSPVLQAAVDGLFACLASWRSLTARLERMPGDLARQEADAVLLRVPGQLRAVLGQGEPAAWVADPIGMRRLCHKAARSLTFLPAGTASLRLLADQTAEVLGGLSCVLEALALLVVEPTGGFRRGGPMRLRIPDALPPLVNAARAFVTIGAAALFWVITEWPSGALAMTWTGISIILFGPKADEAYAVTVQFMVGTALAAVCAAIIKFAVLPIETSFAGFSVILGLYLVPVGALLAQPWRTAVFAPMAGNFVPLLGPANQMSYGTVQFYNTTLAVVAGCCVAALSFRLLQPLSPALRAKRLLELSLRDLRRLASGSVRWRKSDWEGRIYARLTALPDAAEPLHRAQLVAALSVGAGIIHLRRAAPRIGFASELDSALKPIAEGNGNTAIAMLSALADHIASLAGSEWRPQIALRMRGQILGIQDALNQHGPYFDRGGSS
jgi:uncharacterized membrane protein YccC